MSGACALVAVKNKAATEQSTGSSDFIVNGVSALSSRV